MKYGLLFSFLAIAIAGVAVRTGSWSWLLLYPAISFGIVGASYLLSRPEIFGKHRDGSRSALASVLLLPYLVYVAIVWNVVRLVSRESKAVALTDDLILSRRLLANELPSKVASVVDLTCEFTEPIAKWPGVSYLCFPMLDGSGASPEQLRTLAAKIIELPSPVLIHCAQGLGRTRPEYCRRLASVWKSGNGRGGNRNDSSPFSWGRLNRIQRSLLELSR
ncbi:MAG: phosphatase [Pirellulaceae bacterium]